MSTSNKIIRKLRDLWFMAVQKIVSLLFRHKAKIDSVSQKVIDDLHEHGVHVTSVESLFQGNSKKIMDTLASAAAALEVSDSGDLPDYLQKKTSSYDMLTSALISKYPEIFFLGLSEKLLNIVETYLGMPAAYHGVALRRSLIDGLQVGPRVWHKDDEDFRVFRMVIYLHDVTEGGGPFEYVPRSYNLSYKSFQGFESNITAAEMLKVVPQEVLKQVYGKAGTVIICDTANTFHHEKLQEKQRRSVAMLGFSSRIPKNRSLAKSHYPAEAVKNQLLPLLSPSQQTYVYGWRK